MTAFPPCPRGTEDACRLAVGPTDSTLIGYTPVYDRYGKRTNRDPNTHRCNIRCEACGTAWRVTERDGEAVIFDRKGEAT